jgi:3-deoxy-D-manno-octulosonic-acid transferase
MNALDLLYIPVAACTAPWWAFKRREGWRERFGHIGTLAPKRGKRILLHAVSVGEVNALRTLVPHLRQRAEVVVSTTTDTGLARARELFGGECAVVRYPLDFSWAARRFLRAVLPDAVGLVELEVWPNFVAACAKQGTPIAIINGRLSERSMRGYMRIKGFFGGVLKKVSVVGVQDETYAARFRKLGVPPERCSVTGSMKWDAARIEDEVAGAAELGAAMGIDPSRALVVAGSTGPGEEALLVSALPKGAQLLCAPRKPERFEEAAAAMPGCARRSAGGRGNGTYYLLDTIGELHKAYSLASVVVMGRSFGSLYGSDPIEPVALGKATLIGPAVDDFAQVVRVLCDSGGLRQVGREELAGALHGLLSDEKERAAMATAGRACIRGQQGASTRHADLLLSLAGAEEG